MHDVDNGCRGPPGLRVGSGATCHVLNSRLIAGLKDKMTDYKELEIPYQDNHGASTDSIPHGNGQPMRHRYRQ